MSDATGAASTTNATSTAASTPVDTNTEPLFEISYTLDGTSWQTLADVTEDTLALGNYSFPDGVLESATDLSNLQIRISRLPATNTNEALYVDGMSLQVQYDPSTIINNTVRVLPKDLSISNISANGGKLSMQSVPGDTQELIHLEGVPGTTVRFYKQNDPNFSVSTALGDGVNELSIDSINAVGDFVLIDTTEPTGCASLTLLQCRAAAEDLGEVMFTITRTSTQ
jgi:hypothetical protein